ncbi:prolipoprotein diacylglyceryl transferase [Planosporangium flavigriseum]|uniref:Phosphatidylglycerol--prolipoprotein diacylglyceryl transferase n=1 Tax=Planosporangium flavigriseum TaxID=373681 RepID=A0A8J3PKS0_9ACTN|nr:prolipoprotein diacylglyceryl transferase [Planosporangium flavigriseum]NJC63168.1 prolipoprotein diacylglyceryl transferase [Planosporangium flavigriseum]GIG72439.1 prolipoprotein diacylglyceryl transferase 1 [Planosporangium flavigriseum]
MTPVALTSLAAIPSPSQSVWHLGPVPIRAYALCIVLGIVAACAITEIRMRRRGAPEWAVLDIAVWAVPFGIIGARIYHVITSPDAYFGPGGHPMGAFQIWNGGLGIWGAVAGGAVGAWIACRRMGIPLAFVADALAPGLPLAQGLGRWGNWFNNELFGRQTSLPWGLKIYEWDPARGAAKTDFAGNPVVQSGLYHPTFLYESLWCLGVAILVWQLDRRYRFGRGRAFALYVMAYTVGRFWVEAMRSDDAHQILGMRVNNWMSIIVFVGALIYFLRVRGPQERLVVAESGEITVVPADGTAADPAVSDAPVPAGADGAAKAAAADGAAKAEAADGAADVELADAGAPGKTTPAAPATAGEAQPSKQ